MCAHIGDMGSRNISITDEAYKALSREKRKNESFTQVIIRLTRNGSKLSDCFGTWQMSDEERKVIFEKEIASGWHESKEKLKLVENEMP
jgi:predicted CopG family antitoxin